MASKQVAAVAPSANPLATLLADPERLRDFPVETVERLFAMDRELRAESARREFSGSMNRLQGRIEPVRKLARNTHTGSMYARAEDVDRMLAPLLAEEGFSVSCSTVDPAVDGHIRFQMVVRHAGGHEERHYLDAPIDDVGMGGKRSKTAIHGMASSMTYCRRHLLCNVFGVQLTADTDGNRPADSETITTSQAADLSALVQDVGADLPKFLRFFGVSKVSELPASRHREAVRMLEAKR